MIFDFIEPEGIPHILVWMDWKLYQHGGMFAVVIVLNTIVRQFVFPKEYRTSVRQFIIINIVAFFVLLYFIEGSAVG